MSFNASTFKSNLVSAGGGARPSLFKIKLESSLAGVSGIDGSDAFLVKAAAMPASNIAPLAVNYAGRAYKWHGFRTYDLWTVTVINDENFKIRNKIMTWMRKISGGMDGSRTTTIGNQNAAEGNATVTQIGTDGADKKNYKLYNLWPTELGEIAVDWSSDALEEYTIGFSYDYWSSGTSQSSQNNIPPFMRSDFRLKNNIVLLQKATSILPNIYTFKYKWDKITTYIGVMAQELLDTGYSSAVHKDSNGFYSVDYSKFRLPFGKISSI